MMKSTLGTLICFLVLGFFLLASAGRAETVHPASTHRPQAAIQSFVLQDTGNGLF